MSTPGELGGVAAEAHTIDQRRGLRRLGVVAAWLVAISVGAALDGVVGGLVVVVVAAVLLAHLSPRVLGAAGVLALLAVPLAVVIQGIPTDGDVSPTFVSETLIPHHLTFVGLVLVSACAVLEMRPHLAEWRAAAPRTDADLDAPPPLGPLLGVAVTVVVGVGVVWACSAVLGT